MTHAERANIKVGYVPTTGCSGATGTVLGLGWGGLCLSDAGQAKEVAQSYVHIPGGPV
jgi:beta-glucosidase